MKQPKIFNLGLSRTGTTSMHKATQALGMRSTHALNGGGWPLCHYIYPMMRNDFQWLDIWNQFDAFHDLPIPLFYRQFYQQFPDAKFILTPRDKKTWLASCHHLVDNLQSHVRVYVTHNKTPEVMMMLSAFIRYITYGTVDFNKQLYSETYDKHYQDVLDFFDDPSRKSQLLVLPICKPDKDDEQTWLSLCSFLNIPRNITRYISKQPFPHRNKRGG